MDVFFFCFFCASVFCDTLWVVWVTIYWVTCSPNVFVYMYMYVCVSSAHGVNRIQGLSEDLLGHLGLHSQLLVISFIYSLIVFIY